MIDESDGEENKVIIQKNGGKDHWEGKTFDSRMKEERFTTSKRKKNNWKRLRVIRIEKKKNLPGKVIHHGE